MAEITEISLAINHPPSPSKLPDRDPPSCNARTDKEEGVRGERE